jgi:triosephosphate isomerase
MRRPLIAGNWKMHGSVSSTEQLLNSLVKASQHLAQVSMVVCPPNVFLNQAASLLQGSTIALGAQNLNQHKSGAYTGEVAASMLKEVGCQYVIIGHSERRSLFGEQDATIAAKFNEACATNLTPILCIGESQQQRQHGETEQVVWNQVQAVLEQVGTAIFSQGVIAYEPVWAIGTGVTATPEQAQAVHAYIRQQLANIDRTLSEQISIIYGGSMKADNALELIAQADIDGGLVGGASLQADQFIAICQAANQG